MSPRAICWGGPAVIVRTEAAPCIPLRGRPLFHPPGVLSPPPGRAPIPPVRGRPPDFHPPDAAMAGTPLHHATPFGCSNSAHPPSMLPCYHQSGGHSPLHPPDWGRHRMCLADWLPPARSHPPVPRGSACKAPPFIVAGGRKARPGTEVLKSRGGPAPGSDGPPFQRFFIFNQTPGCVVICFPQGFSPRATKG